MKRNLEDRTCEICGKTFSPTAPNARTCSQECAAELNRQRCRDRYRESVLMTPYKIPDMDKPEQPRASDPKETPSDRNPEPSSPSEEAEQADSVRRTMALPPSQRYQFSRRWSAFQRRFAVKIEKGRLADEAFIGDFSASTTVGDSRSRTTIWDSPSDR